MTTILDLPPEILERILVILRPNLAENVKLSSVCTKFRSVCSNVPLAVHIPVTEEELHILTSRQIPIRVVCNREPAMFVQYQIVRLNLSRLQTAELVCSDDYDGQKRLLSSDYYAILHSLSLRCSNALQHLVMNCDLAKDINKRCFRALTIISSFKNLTFLSLAFTNQIALQQKVQRKTDGRDLIRDIVCSLPKLTSLYIFSCPSDDLVILSASLEKLHIYRSEFAALSDLETPNLKKLMFHDSIAEFFNKIGGSERDRPCVHEKLFNILYEKCPRLECFNGVDIKCLRNEGLSEKEWSYVVLRLCVKAQRRLLKS